MSRAYRSQDRGSKPPNRVVVCVADYTLGSIHCTLIQRPWIGTINRCPSTASQLMAGISNFGNDLRLQRESQ